jgi:hypothetical protein
MTNFTGLGDGFSWEDEDNWDNGVPSDEAALDIIIGAGFDVVCSSETFFYGPAP